MMKTNPSYYGGVLTSCAWTLSGWSGPGTSQWQRKRSRRRPNNHNFYFDTLCVRYIPWCVHCKQTCRQFCTFSSLEFRLPLFSRLKLEVVSPHRLKVSAKRVNAKGWIPAETKIMPRHLWFHVKIACAWLYQGSIQKTHSPFQFYTVMCSVAWPWVEARLDTNLYYTMIYMRIAVRKGHR